MILGQPILKLALNPFMLVLEISSIFALWAIIDRLIAYMKISEKEERKIIERTKILIEKGRFEELKAFSSALNRPFAKIVNLLAENIHYPKEVLESILESALMLTRLELGKKLNVLGTISYIAPLLGLLGTVVGIIQAFYAVAQKGAAVGPEAMMEGVAIALLTTALGIMIAVPCAIMYNYFRNKIDHLMARIEVSAEEIMNFMVYVKEQKEKVP
ncbi:MAG: MotA/TolQ/ExbB proton channel family protein [Candidatus Hydrothermales bacterium]